MQLLQDALYCGTTVEIVRQIQLKNHHHIRNKSVCIPGVEKNILYVYMFKNSILQYMVLLLSDLQEIKVGLFQCRQTSQEKRSNTMLSMWSKNIYCLRSDVGDVCPHGGSSMNHFD